MKKALVLVVCLLLAGAVVLAQEPNLEEEWRVNVETWVGFSPHLVNLSNLGFSTALSVHLGDQLEIGYIVGVSKENEVCIFLGADFFKKTILTKDGDSTGILRSFGGYIALFSKENEDGKIDPSLYFIPTASIIFPSLSSDSPVQLAGKLGIGLSLRRELVFLASLDIKVLLCSFSFVR